MHYAFRLLSLALIYLWVIKMVRFAGNVGTNYYRACDQSIIPSPFVFLYHVFFGQASKTSFYHYSVLCYIFERRTFEKMFIEKDCRRSKMRLFGRILFWQIGTYLSFKAKPDVWKCLRSFKAHFNDQRRYSREVTRLKIQIVNLVPWYMFTWTHSTNSIQLLFESFLGSEQLLHLCV